MAGRVDQSLLLVVRNARRRAAVACVAPGAYLDEDEGVTVLGNEVNLAATTAIIARNQGQALAFEEGRRLPLCGITALLGYASPRFHSCFPRSP